MNEQERISNELFRQLVDSAPDAMVITDADGSIVLVNAQAEKLFGYSRRELIGETLERLMPERFRAAHGVHRAGYARESKARAMGGELELFALHKSGREVPVEISLSPVEAGGRRLVSSSIRDVGVRRQVERSARVASERLMSAIESFHGALSLYDADDRLTLCNSTARALFGSVLTGTLIGSSYPEIVDACIAAGMFAAREEPPRLRARLLAYHAAPAGTLDLSLANGATLRLTSRRTPEGGVICTLIDVTEDVEIAAQLRAARAEAEAASSAKSEFLSSMSHELRTPMNAILGFAQLLQRDKRAPLSPAQREKLEYVLQGGEHLLRLIDDVLDLSRIEAGRVTMSPQPVVLGELLAEVRQTLEPIATRAGIRLEIDPPGEGAPRVFADRTRCKQILLNFGSNAVKYGRPHGHASIRSSLVGEDRLRLSVRDDGIGIPVDMQHKIFQPFQRAGQEGGPIEGTGIGLSITRRLAELMNGRVGFSSAAGVGSEFWLELPVHRRGACSVQPDAVAAVPVSVKVATAEALVVYIEDNRSNIAFMRGVIDELPHVRLVSAPNAEVGIEVARARKPGVVLMDINLPGMNGFEAAKRLKDWPETKDIPVIALTAAAMLGDRTRLAEAGFARYLTKPVQVADLLEALQSTLRTSG